jgi:beta-lactam-binding protein with PASTA domain
MRSVFCAHHSRHIHRSVCSDRRFRGLRSAVQAAGAVFGLVFGLLCAGLPAVAVSGDAVLTGSVARAPANVDLSVKGNLDWAKWGPRVSEFNHKSGVTQQISNFTVIGGGVSKRYRKTASSYYWTNGSPTVSAENVNGGVRIFERGGGFQIKIPADTTDRRLKLYVGAKKVKGKVEAALSDGSVPPFTTFVDQVRGKTTVEITLDYRAASVGQTLTVNWTVDTKYARKGSAVSLEAAALVGSSTTSDELATVPNVVGLTQANAKAAISTARLSVGTITTATSDTVPPGVVISQTPGNGTAVASGSAVDLAVSSGAAPVKVPNVVGLTQANAKAAISTALLSVGTITTATSDTVPAGVVISQTPGGGTEVSQGSAVALSVSSGPASVTVPNVVGLTQANAESAIVAAGLTVGAVTTATSDSVPAGNVINQTPGSGTAVTSGSAVDLAVSSGAAPVILSWVAPVTKTDGTPLSLSEIAGFRIYSGVASDNLSLMADVNDGSATTYTVTGLSSGTHYFAATTYDYSNNESAYSSIASRTIP